MRKASREVLLSRGLSELLIRTRISRRLLVFLFFLRSLFLGCHEVILRELFSLVRSQNKSLVREVARHF
jgi:hypothetical protein